MSRLFSAFAIAILFAVPRTIEEARATEASAAGPILLEVNAPGRRSGCFMRGW